MLLNYVSYSVLSIDRIHGSSVVVTSILITVLGANSICVTNKKKPGCYINSNKNVRSEVYIEIGACSYLVISKASVSKKG